MSGSSSTPLRLRPSIVVVIIWYVGKISIAFKRSQCCMCVRTSRMGIFPQKVYYHLESVSFVFSSFFDF